MSGCSELGLQVLAQDLARELRVGDRVLLEGPMGAGKTTFARALLAALKVQQPAEGSPSFAIAHEYLCPRGEIVHLDLYRIRDESELEEAGIPAYFWERSAIVISEWLSSWPNLETSVLRSGRAWEVKLAFDEEDPERRSIIIFKKE